MAEKFDVFISYRREDGSELANQVKAYLEEKQIHAYLDVEDMIDGQYFDTQLKTRIVEAPVYVLITTPEVFNFRKESGDQKDWVLEEIRTALSEHKKAPDERKVIPFVMHGTTVPDSLPMGLEDLPRENRIDLKGTKANGGELLRLSKAICFVNARNLWNTGRSTLEQSKAEGGRFNLLRIDERIMPLYKKDKKKSDSREKPLPINVNTAESKEEVALADAIKAQSGNLYLIGEGGIGKTTAMISIMEQHYKDKPYSAEDEIPLFVELNRAPAVFDLWYRGVEGMESSFIRREICRQLLHHTNIKYVPSDYLDNLDAEFRKKTDKPGYLLLLDGLNEVNNNEVVDPKRKVNGCELSGYVRSLIIGEINYLLTQCPNVRVMLTSRTDETEVNCTEHHIEKLYLTGLKDDTISEYLKSKKFSSREVKDALADERLRDCIRIPLFLTLYAALNKTKDVSSRGEIFRRFFHERGDSLQDEYTQKKQIETLKVDKPQLRFMLDILLPAIGSKMEHIGEFKLTAEEIARIIEPVLKGEGPNGQRSENMAYPASAVGEYGKQCFSDYKRSESLPKIAKSILAIDEDMSEVAEYILTIAVDILCIMYRDGESEYGFIH